MVTKRHIRPRYLLLAPAAGVLLYVAMYVAASFLYPGGSEADRAAQGFSWVHNYWCNLLYTNAINGAPNPARPLALGGMVVLCASLGLFWYQFPVEAGMRRPLRVLTQVAGGLSMATAVFVFTGRHDVVINIAGICGVIAILGTMAGLRTLGWQRLWLLGCCNLALVVVNNVLYYSEGLLPYLPVVQKITFSCFLLWIGLASVQLYKMATPK